MPQNSQSPMFMRMLADALRQRSMSPEPSYDSMGRPVEQEPPMEPQMGQPMAAEPPMEQPMPQPMPDPTVQMPLGSGIAAQGADAIRRAQIQRAMQLQQMQQ